MKAAGGRRTDGILAVLLLLLLVAGIVALGTAGSKSSDPFEVRRSAFLTTPTGARALHDLLGGLGYDVRRHRASLRQVPAGTSTLVLLSPPLPMGQDEVRGVLSWVDAGGTLVFSLGGGSLAPTASDGNRDSDVAALARELGVRVRRTPTTQYEIETLGPLGEEAPFLRFSGGRVLEGNIVHSPGFEPLVRNRFGPVAAALHRGRGKVVLFADDTLLTNRLLRHPDNAVLLVRVCAPEDGRGVILFDERHQGYGDRGDAAARLAGALAETGLGFLLLQGLLCAGVFLYATGRRFGSPRPEPRARRRRSAETAIALGRAYAAAGAHALVAETLAAAARRRAAARLGIPPSLDGDEFNRRLRASRNEEAHRLADALERLAEVEKLPAGRKADRALAEAVAGLGDGGSVR